MGLGKEVQAPWCKCNCATFHGSRPCFAEFPLIFRLLRDENEYDTEEEKYLSVRTLGSTDDMTRVITQTLSHRARKLDMSVPYKTFIGAKGDGAANAVACTKVLNGRSEALATLGTAIPSKSDIINTETKCLAHALGLAIKGAIGYNPPSSEMSAIPPGPDEKVSDFFSKIRKAVSQISDPKCFVQLKEKAKSNGGDTPCAVHLDMDMRWLSFFQMIEGFLSILPVYDALQRDNLSLNLPRFSSSENVALRELVAILRPLMEATTFLETSNFPLAPYVLPMISCIFRRYGVTDPTKLLTKAVEPDAYMRISFEVPILINKETEVRKVRGMKQISQMFMKVLVTHLEYRLCTERRNRNAVDLLAAWTDPFGRYMLKFWLRDENVRNYCKEIAKRFRDRIQGSVKSDDDGSSESDDSDYERVVRKRPRHCDSFVIEWEDFEEEVARSIETAFNLKVGDKFRFDIETLIKAAERLNPLQFWTPSRREKYKAIFRVASLCFGSASHSCLQQPVFSSAEDTLTPRRARLDESPDSLEALIVLRYAGNTSSA